jgi:hypothetical protein
VRYCASIKAGSEIGRDAEAGGDRALGMAGKAGGMAGETGTECGFRLRNTPAAARTDAQLPREVPYGTGARLDGAANVSVRNGIANAYDHGNILNANENDCQ